MKTKLTLGIFLLTLQLSPAVYAQAPAEGAPNPYGVATFECAGLYWKTPLAGPGKVRYRQLHDGSWKPGLDMVYDAKRGEYRGSIIRLQPDTDYEVELSTDSAKTSLSLRTRNDHFPIGKRTILPAGGIDHTIRITTSGTPDAYHLVTVAENQRSVMDLMNASNHGLEIDADYVIVSGVEIRNAAIHGIQILKGRHDIVVENCHITFWGRIGGPKSFGNFDGHGDSAIYAEFDTYNLTLQRNLLDNPRGGSNDWESGHPNGPNGISVLQSKGGNVIRYNDIVSTEDHGFLDGIGGAVNFSEVGNMNRDSDIYGNLVRSVWDDAIECEGANMNVRIWGNYLSHYFNGLSSAATSVGPLYLFRNILAVSRSGHANSLGGLMFKTGTNRGFGGGRRFMFHNTAVQPNGPFNVFSAFWDPSPSSTTRNNVFDVPGNLGPPVDEAPFSDCDYDYFSGIAQFSAAEPHRINPDPPHHRGGLFASSQKLEFYPSARISQVVQGRSTTSINGKEVLVNGMVEYVKNPLIDSGVILPGFNEDFKGEGPDVGAFEVGAPPLEFGRRAYCNYDEGLAPWEK
ncbi:MAG: hypothetical protein KJT03_05695 [Verrucomicrobiae bacterium]|nr:hypothetical protein [Verrucomicrobiae bacterium]